MSLPQAPQPAKLVIGCLLSSRDLLTAVVDRLGERFGPIDLVGPWMPFDYTTYYDAEMGRPLARRMVAFGRLVEQDRLADIKRETNRIERLFARNGRRQVNIDPGYLLPERFVLATGKNYAHRIYIGRKIYADLTLTFYRGAFRPLPWTYPDYAAPAMHRFLLQARSKYRHDIRRATARADDR